MLGSKNYYKIKLEFDISFIKKILNQAIPLFISFMLLNVMVTFGKIYLSLTNGDYKTGLIEACIKLSAFAIIPTYILQGAFAPRISKCFDINQRQNIAKKYTTIVVSVGAIISAVMFFFPEFCIYVCFLGKNEFQNATNILKIFAVNTMFYYVANTIVSFF